MSVLDCCTGVAFCADTIRTLCYVEIWWHFVRTLCERFGLLSWDGFLCGHCVSFWACCVGWIFVRMLCERFFPVVLGWLFVRMLCEGVVLWLLFVRTLCVHVRIADAMCPVWHFVWTLHECFVLCRITASSEQVVLQQLQELKARELIREMESGAFVRQVLEEKTGDTGILFDCLIGPVLVVGRTIFNSAFYIGLFVVVA